MPTRLRRLLPILAAAMLLAGVAEAGFYDRVRQGESLADFARRHRVTTQSVAGANRLAANARPSPGTLLYVPKIDSSRGRPAGSASAPAPRPAARPAAPAASPAPARNEYTVRSGDTLSGIAARLGRSTKDLAEFNGISNPNSLKVGQRLEVPPEGWRAAEPEPAPRAERREEPPAPSARNETRSGGGGNAPPASSPSARRGRFIWPLEGRVVRRFRDTATEKQLGLNIAAPVGTPVRAARDGRVIYSSDAIDAYGHMVIVQHDDGVATCYAHTQGALVREGQQVRQGEIIARVGNTGRGLEPFLHFEVRRNGAAVNPEQYLP
ncbi:MAG: peptidoglycan DD-metalloendopeptidase family protein [Candidatus Sumerlaeia bacterium]|nr:peptidoglycan DD-metalloendopeptidase family protein [Candidatus Sumerlaeia bacterium]